MRTTTAATTTDDIIETIAAYGFVPADELAELYGPELDARQIKSIRYLAPRWQASRLDGHGDELTIAWVAWDEATVKVEITTDMGVTLTEATFTANRRGLAMLAAALDA